MQFFGFLIFLLSLRITVAQWGYGPYSRGYGGYGGSGSGYGPRWGRYGGYGGYGGGWGGQQARNIGNAAAIGTDVAEGVLVAEEVFGK